MLNIHHVDKGLEDESCRPSVRYAPLSCT